MWMEASLGGRAEEAFTLEGRPGPCYVHASAPPTPPTHLCCWSPPHGQVCTEGQAFFLYPTPWAWPPILVLARLLCHSRFIDRRAGCSCSWASATFDSHRGLASQLDWIQVDSSSHGLWRHPRATCRTGSQDAEGWHGQRLPDAAAAGRQPLVPARARAFRKVTYRGGRRGARGRSLCSGRSNANRSMTHSSVRAARRDKVNETRFLPAEEEADNLS